MPHPRQTWPLALALACAPTTGDATTSTTDPASTSSPTPEPTWITSSTDQLPTDPDPTTTSTTGSQTTSGPGTTTEIPDFGEHGLGCGGKIDFLFVLSRGHLMDKYWSRFWSVFPDFIDDILEGFGNFDMHFMVVDGYGSMTSDVSGWGMTECIEPCEDNGTCYPVGPHEYPCDAYDEGVHETCGMKGAGIVFPAGFEAANHDCGVVGSQRFVSSREQPDAATTVKCISQVGHGLSHARPIVSMLWAADPNKKPAACNQGFLRDDALLVVVYYSYYDDGVFNPEGPPGQWAESLYSLKGGDEDKVAVIGLIDDGTYSEDVAVCPSGTGGYGEPIAEFLHFYIKHKVEGSICADDYAPYLDAGVELIGELCEMEIPK